MTRPSPARDTPVRDWLPFQHVDYACDLLDPKIEMGGNNQGITNWRLDTAQAHIAVAHAKMTGRQRA